MFLCPGGPPRWGQPGAQGLFQDFCEVDYAGIRVDSLATMVGQPRRRRIFFRARSLATIDTLPNWPKIRPSRNLKTAVFSPVDFISPPMNRQCQCSQNVQPMQEPTTHTTDSRAVLDFHYAGGAAH